MSQETLTSPPFIWRPPVCSMEPWCVPLKAPKSCSINSSHHRTVRSCNKNLMWAITLPILTSRSSLPNQPIWASFVKQWKPFKDPLTLNCKLSSRSATRSRPTLRCCSSWIPVWRSKWCKLSESSKLTWTNGLTSLAYRSSKTDSKMRRLILPVRHRHRHSLREVQCSRPTWNS